jgi:hypothetical protein
MHFTTPFHFPMLFGFQALCTSICMLVYGDSLDIAHHPGPQLASVHSRPEVFAVVGKAKERTSMRNAASKGSWR